VIGFRPLVRDWVTALLCYACAFFLCVSPLVQYQFDSWGPLILGTIALGTPLTAIGVWLNHLAERSASNKR
jgi:hypothetical protein